jgi:hypothetical protein
MPLVTLFGHFSTNALTSNYPMALEMPVSDGSGGLALLSCTGSDLACFDDTSGLGGWQSANVRANTLAYAVQMWSQMTKVQLPIVGETQFDTAGSGTIGGGTPA